jgi:CheY-like chemotaxis protein
MKDIVVVTRNEDISHVMARALGEDYNISTIVSLEDLYPRLKNKKPSLILFDISPPYDEALKKCRRLKEDPQTKNIPLIAIFTAVWERERREVFESTRADHLLKKPFSIKEFREAVYSWA